MVETDMPRRAALRSDLRNLLYDCSVSTAAQQAQRLREAARLLRMPAAEHLAFETMIECGAHESAVLLLIGRRQPFLLSQGKSGTCLASTVIGDKADEVTAEAATPALAVLSAHVTAMLTKGGRNGLNFPRGHANKRLH